MKSIDRKCQVCGNSLNETICGSSLNENIYGSSLNENTYDSSLNENTYDSSLNENTYDSSLNENTSLCNNCGWVQELDLDNPNSICWSYNFVSYNRARELYPSGKAIYPSFPELLVCMKIYSELEFFFNNEHFGLITNKDNEICFYKWNNTEYGYQTYNGIDEFGRFANIDGVLLRDIWDKTLNLKVAD